MVHIGIIPDGNRRWCKKNEFKLDTLIDNWTKIIIENGIKIVNNRFKYLKEVTELSLYVCSIDNINREDNTKNLIYGLIKNIYNIYKNPKELLSEDDKYELLKDYTEEKFQKIIDYYSTLIENTNINFIGEVSLLPPDIQEILSEIIILSGKTDNSKYTINVAIAYDYKKDLINEGTHKIKNYNRRQSDIDLVFRSGGEFRTSGFFPTKILYSELFFSKKLWPEITFSDINNTIRKFYKRNRRFGK